MDSPEPLVAVPPEPSDCRGREPVVAFALLAGVVVRSLVDTGGARGDGH